MIQCNSQLLSAYADGELKLSGRVIVEQHVRTCAQCAQELRELEEISGRIRAMAFDDLTEDESDRLHAAIAELHDDGRVFRIGGVTALIAASIMVISGVWLMVLPAGGPSVSGNLAPTPAWERTAMTLQPEQQESYPGGQTRTAQADAVNWMIRDLGKKQP